MMLTKHISVLKHAHPEGRVYRNSNAAEDRKALFTAMLLFFVSYRYLFPCPSRTTYPPKKKMHRCDLVVKQ